MNRAVHCRAQRGLSLVELMISIVIVSLVSAAAAALLSVALRIDGEIGTQENLEEDGQFVMAQIRGQLQTATSVTVPSSATPASTQLSYSGRINDDNDYYFGDALFPRIDEDPPGDANGDGKPGIGGLDDNGDGAVDNGNTPDDDEDGVSDEDPLNPIIVSLSNGSLIETIPSLGRQRVLSTSVTGLNTTYEPGDGTRDPCYRVKLTLALDNVTVTIDERVFPRNLTQPLGKQVR